MNFKIKMFFTFFIISVFLLSGCDVYKTLYGTGTNSAEPMKELPGKVARIEGPSAKDPANLKKMLYAAADATQHDPFKAGEKPLGPFQSGKPLGFTLGQWLSAGGIGIYSVDNENAEMELSFKNLIPNGVYTVLCSRIKFPPNPSLYDAPCGAEDGSENKFTSDAKGIGEFSLKLKPLFESTKEEASGIALVYHSDGKTYGASPGDFGLNSHVQLFFLMPAAASNLSAYQVPIKFMNHIDAGMPEQDVFIEMQEEKNETKSEESSKEKGSQAIEKSNEKPAVVIVQETYLVDLVPKAEDPDKNTTLTFTFTSPLNEKGQWQTTYGDAGEYTVTLTASDGEATTARDALIIVNKKEEPPVIDTSKPIESGLTVDETQSIDFSISASDLNKDPLTYSWKLDGTDAGSDNKYTYKTTYDDAGTHTVKVEVSDGTSSASRIWSVNVKNVNRKPVLEKIENINVKENEKVTITALATDDDKDQIIYSISDKRFVQEDNVFTWQTDYDSSGQYRVVVSASDGKDTTEQEVMVDVENVNRPPVITDIVQKK